MVKLIKTDVVRCNCEIFRTVIDNEFIFKEKEVTNGGAAPRMMCMDDYFMVEHEKVEKDPETGKTVKKTVTILYLFN